MNDTDSQSPPQPIVPQQAAPIPAAPLPLDHSKTPNPQEQFQPLQKPSAPTSSQILPKHHNFPLHKALLIAAITLGIIFLTAYVGVYYLLNQQLDKITKAKKIAASTSTLSQITPSPTIGFPAQPTAAAVTYNAIEIDGFPAYPGATFIGKSKTSPCETTNGYALCGGLAYTWETKDNYDQISNFYRNDPSQSGWKCAGGAGEYESPRSSSGVTQCKKGTSENDLNVTSTQEKTTIIFEVQTAPTPTLAVACTQEAKQCSDGSYVSRAGPNCEFTACP